MEIKRPPGGGSTKDKGSKPVSNPQGVTTGKRPAFAEKSYLQRAREAYDKYLDTLTQKE